jgi:flagellar protein FliO/FliZ
VVNPILLLISTTVQPAATASEPVFTDAQWTAAAPRPNPAAPTTDLVGSSLLSIGISLAAVIALAVFLGWLVKRLGVKRLVQPKGRHLEVVDSVALGFKRQASLIRLGDQVILVGISEQGVSHLATLPAHILGGETALGVSGVLPAPASGAAPVPPPDPAFRNLLTKVLKG